MCSFKSISRTIKAKVIIAKGVAKRNVYIYRDLAGWLTLSLLSLFFVLQQPRKYAVYLNMDIIKNV